ncbi:splicing regulator SDE2 [Zeugodacus cucurbitae]|uniref:splicing regulator SDE2 n=1 Tax=Zeugodacus cucurbitae TaxID=28588 RepID=UPI000596A6FD|nr:splicing regulator SDE2 [Zeugodacus cucurbitae]
MAFIYLNKELLLKTNVENCLDIKQLISQKCGLLPNEIYLEKNGRRLTLDDKISGVAQCRVCILGGKGGFGSMLRAIGAQIEKTTNREACRDLSGRRLRDINEEKRLKAVLEKMGDLERESQERKKRKIEKLLSVPKHDFKDAEYEDARAKLEDKVNSAVEEGLKKNDNKPSSSSESLKRKHTQTSKADPKKKKNALWIDDDLLNSDESSSEDSSDESNVQKVVVVKKTDTVSKEPNAAK